MPNGSEVEQVTSKSLAYEDLHMGKYFVRPRIEIAVLALVVAALVTVTGISIARRYGQIIPLCISLIALGIGIALVIASVRAPKP